MFGKGVYFADVSTRQRSEIYTTDYRMTDDVEGRHFNIYFISLPRLTAVMSSVCQLLLFPVRQNKWDVSPDSSVCIAV